METGQEFAITGNSPFSDRKLTDMGIAKILATQEYAHMYCMWKSITADDCTWVRLKANLQEAYLEKEDLKQTEGATGYGITNNVKYGEMEDAFMSFALATVVRNADPTNMMTTNGKFPNQSRHQEDRIRALQAELCNLKLAAATRTSKLK